MAIKFINFDYDESNPTAYEYTAADFRTVYNQLSSNGIVLSPTVSIATDTSLKVVAITGGVRISSGIAAIQGAFAVVTDEDLPYSPFSGDGTYKVILEFNSVLNKIYAKLSVDALTRTSAVWQLQLATVVKSGSTYTVTDTRANASLCGYANRLFDVSATKIPSFTNVLENPQFNGTSNWTMAPNGFIVDTVNTLNSCNTMVCNRSGLSSATPVGLYSAKYNCNVGETYTLSVFVKLNAAKLADLRNTSMVISLYTASSVWVADIPIAFSTQNIIADTWAKVSLSYTSTQPTVARISAIFYCEGNGSMQVALPQLEVGNTYYATQATANLKVNTADIINDLTHTDTNKPLSANQGKALKALIDAIGGGTTLTNAQSLQGKPISTTAPVDKQIPIFKAATGEIEYGYVSEASKRLLYDSSWSTGSITQSAFGQYNVFQFYLVGASAAILIAKGEGGFLSGSAGYIAADALILHNYIFSGTYSGTTFTLTYSGAISQTIATSAMTNHPLAVAKIYGII